MRQVSCLSPGYNFYNCPSRISSPVTCGPHSNDCNRTSHLSDQWLHVLTFPREQEVEPLRWIFRFWMDNQKGEHLEWRNLYQTQQDCPGTFSLGLIIKTDLLCMCVLPFLSLRSEKENFLARRDLEHMNTEMRHYEPRSSQLVNYDNFVLHEPLNLNYLSSHSRLSGLGPQLPSPAWSLAIPFHAPAIH